MSDADNLFDIFNIHSYSSLFLLLNIFSQIEIDGYSINITEEICLNPELALCLMKKHSFLK